MNYKNTYNHHIPQRALNHLSPIEALQEWREKSSELFVKRVYKQAELDSLTMTMRYAHLAPDHLAEAMKLNPMAALNLR